ncbi:lipopolysaccharide biosynthesis protein [Aquicoccus porphyridii]|nr:lipopolysaccharide biosynthesis protein [Aquicoccus porphyridii]
MRAALWVFAGKLGNQVITLGIVMILARLLTPQDFGVVAASQVILTLSQVVVRFGIGAYLIQAEALTPRIVGTAQTLMLTVALLISVILFSFAGPIGDAINVPELVQIMPILLASFMLSAAINPSASLLSRDMDFKFLAQTEISSQAIGYGGVAVALAALGFGFWALILGTLAQTLMRAVLVFWRMPVWPNHSMTMSEIKPMLRFGGGVFLAQLMSNTAQRVDNLVITSVMGPAALGFYGRAYSLMEISNKLIGSVFRETLFSGFSKKRREGQGHGRDSMFLMAHAFAAFLILPIMALMWLLAEEIVWVILGPKWDAAVPVLEILALGMYFRLGYKVSGTFILSEGAVYSLALRNLAYAVLVAAGALIGSRWGLPGVAWGVFGALVIHFVSMTTTALNFSGSQWRAYGKTASPFLIAGNLAWALAYGVQKGLDEMPTLSALAAAATFAAVYSAGLFITRRHHAVQVVAIRIAKSQWPNRTIRQVE